MKPITIMMLDRIVRLTRDSERSALAARPGPGEGYTLTVSGLKIKASVAPRLTAEQALELLAEELSS